MQLLFIGKRVNKLKPFCGRGIQSRFGFEPYVKYETSAHTRRCRVNRKIIHDQDSENGTFNFSFLRSLHVLLAYIIKRTYLLREGERSNSVLSYMYHQAIV